MEKKTVRVATKHVTAGHTAPAVKKQKDESSAQLAFSFFPFHSFWVPRPHSRCIFPSQLNTFEDTLEIQTCPEVCLLGDSKSSHADNEEGLTTTSVFTPWECAIHLENVLYSNDPFGHYPLSSSEWALLCSAINKLPSKLLEFLPEVIRIQGAKGSSHRDLKRHNSNNATKLWVD